MCEKHYSIMMMGEDSTDDLQEREDALANAMAEYDAVQDGGLGGYYDDDNYGYNYQDSNPLTDIDYQPGNDESSAFTDNYTGAEDYDPVARDNEEESDDEDFDGDDEEESDDYDGGGENSNDWGRTAYDDDDNEKTPVTVIMMKTMTKETVS